MIAAYDMLKNGIPYAAVLALAAACSDAVPNQIEQDPVTVDAGRPDVTSTPTVFDAAVEASVEEDAAPDVVVVVDSSPPDSTTVFVDAGSDVVDASTPDVSVVDAAPDSPSDAGSDAGPCLDYVQVPVSPYWAARAHYTLWVDGGSSSSQSVPYYCPGSPEGVACRYALGDPADGKFYPSGCHMDVPTKCLPCTGGVTQW